MNTVDITIICHFLSLILYASINGAADSAVIIYGFSATIFTETTLASSMSAGKGIKKADAINIIKYWYRKCMEDESISIDDIINIMILYWHMTVLRFSDKYKSAAGWRLSDDNTKVERIATNRSHSKVWILADNDPWFKGIHCWRIKLKNPNKGWFAIGVCNQDIGSMNIDYINKTYFWGIGANNNWFQKGGSHGKREGESYLRQYIRLECVEIDVYLNLDKDKPEMKICAVSNGKPLRESRLYDPKDNDKGWVQYFNMYIRKNIEGSTIRAVFIDPDSYGIPIDNLFPTLSD